MWLEMENATYKNDSNSVNFSDYKAPLLFIHSALFVVIIVGNLCVLKAIAISDQGRKTRMNFFIMHLAIADLSVGLIYVATEIGSLATDYKWMGGMPLCKMVQFSKVLVFYASTYMLVSLSIDRFDAIARPMKFSQKAFRARLLVCSSWVAAALFSIPSLVLFETRDELDNNITMCTIHLHQPWMWQVYMTLVFFSMLLLPAMIIAVCYVVIAVIIWKKSKALEEGSDAMCNLRDGQAFIICWSPYFLISLLQVYKVIDDSSTTMRVTIAYYHALAPLNSAINPVIYGVFSTRICGNLRQIPVINKLIKCLQCCKTSRHESYRSSRSASENDHSLNGTVLKKSRNPILRTKCVTENDTVVTLLRTNSDKSGQHVSFMQPVSNGNQSNKHKGYRRPSGLPLVKRNITEEENILLKSLTNRLQKVP